MQQTKNMNAYKEDIKHSLENKFLRDAMDNFAQSYRLGREKAFSKIDKDRLIKNVSDIKDNAIIEYETLLKKFIQNAEKKGIQVHYAKTAESANQIISEIAENNNVKQVIKSKSMTAEETLLNKFLEKKGIEITETDLGEWIIQLRKEGPSHMVMPAIHLSRFQVADLFSKVTANNQDPDIEKLVKVARSELRKKFFDADMGISGANFLLADTATIGIITNEGNARLVTTLPQTHVVLTGIEKILPTLSDALNINKVLPKNATGQKITSYVTWITGPAETETGEKKEMHIVLLDNGRSALAKNSVFSSVLKCIRCGACANVCPVYRMIGGHKMGHIYIGPIGLVLTYFYHGAEKTQNIIYNCLNCGACKSVCASGIDLPEIILKTRKKISSKKGKLIKDKMISKILSDRTLFNTFLKSTKFIQKPFKNEDGYLRHLPMFFFKDHNYKSFPAIADKPFRERWEKKRKTENNQGISIAIFSGCLHDFVYPEQLEAFVDIIENKNISIDFPEKQTCCGLPLKILGEFEKEKELAIQNVETFDHKSYDYIVTLCASCASHLKKGYKELNIINYSELIQKFSEKVITFSTLMNDIFKINKNDYTNNSVKTTFHSPCHLCRGLDITEEPIHILKNSKVELIRAKEEQTCCGFGGSYSLKFPEISSEIMKKKIKDFESTGAKQIVTECPGCILQLRGGVKKNKSNLEVLHISEVLKENLNH